MMGAFEDGTIKWIEIRVASQTRAGGRPTLGSGVREKTGTEGQSNHGII